MLKDIKFILLICCAIIPSEYLVGCDRSYDVSKSGTISGFSEKKDFLERSVDDHDKFLWEKTVKPYLEDDLWLPRDLYDAGHNLMVPLHAAFILNVPDWQQQFSQHFLRFMKKDHTSFQNSDQDIDIDIEHYLYLASRFVVLAVQNDRKDLIPAGLVERLQREILILWDEKPAWWYGREAFKGGISERVNWKLNQNKVEYTYYRAIIDQELFFFAMAADLRAFERLTKPKEKWCKTNSEILAIANKIFGKYISYTKDGGWLLQRGVWRDHPDYAYAGNNNISKGMLPVPLNDVAEDSSHSHRWPVWLISFSLAYDRGDYRRVYFENLRKGLEQQFYEKVLVRPTQEFSGYRVVNFMDGRNGVYRWEYPTQGKGKGYGPYELSGILIEGWWGLLGTERIRKVYAEMANCFPLTQEIMNSYIGPNTSRERNAFVKWPNFFINGFGELNVRLASKIIL